MSELQLTTQALSQLLWRVDPMNTGCNAGEGMEDEYDNLAADIAQALAEGQAPREAVTGAFDEWFWEGCLNEGSRAGQLEQLLALMAR